MPEIEILEELISKEALALIYPYGKKNLTGKMLASKGWTRSGSVSIGLTKEIETSKKIDILQKQIDNLTSMLTNRPIIKNAVLRDLNSRKYSLKENIEFLIEECPDETIAQWPEVEIFGHGVTQPEAILDLKNEVIDLYEELLTSKQKELGKLPKMWLRILNQVIKKNE